MCVTPFASRAFLFIFSHVGLTIVILSLCVSAHLTVLLHLNSVLNLTVPLLPSRLRSHSYASASYSGGTAAAAPPPFRPSDPALYGSSPLVSPYYCRLGDLLCLFCVYPFVHRCDKRLQKILCKRVYYFVNVYLNKNHMSETKQNYDGKPSYSALRLIRSLIEFIGSRC